MRSVKTVMRHIAGWTLLLVGIAGLVLPILQGWLFIAIAAVLLAPDVPIFARLLCWVQERSPGLGRAVARFRSRFGHAPAPCPPEGDSEAREKPRRRSA
jgi:uncharacterized protein